MFMEAHLLFYLKAGESSHHIHILDSYELFSYEYSSYV